MMLSYGTTESLKTYILKEMEILKYDRPDVCVREILRSDKDSTNMPRKESPLLFFVFSSELTITTKRDSTLMLSPISTNLVFTVNLVNKIKD